MPPAAWRLFSLPLILLALLLAGAPEFPAFERAIRKAFSTFATLDSAAPVPQRSVPPLPPTARVERRQDSRRALVPLYVSFATLQALDAHSTLRALNGGATEANPLMAGLAGNPAALVAVKAGLTASTIYLVEKLRVKSRGAAIALMAALNSAYAAIVAHNYRAIPR